MEKTTFSQELIVIQSHYNSKSRHLNLNVLMREHFGVRQEEERKPTSKKENAEKQPTANSIVFGLLLVVFSMAGCSKLSESRLNYSPTYTWQYKGRQYQTTFYLSKSEYDYYSSLPRQQEYSEFVKQDSLHPYLEYVAENLVKIVEDDNLTQTELAAYLLSFVQQLPYKESSKWLYPIEVLVRGGVYDCKRACLYSALLETVGIKSILIFYNDHMAVGVNCNMLGKPYCTIENKPYYFAETTSPQWELGQIPPRKDGYTSLIAGIRTAHYTVRKPATNKRYSIIRKKNEGQLVTE